MLVTIGLPIYNAEIFLSDCIKSILNQTYKNLEIILVNDGSTDNSLEIIKKFQDPRIKIINDGLNKGLIFRLNQMVEISNGEFFVRMDADDIMFPDRIENQLKVFKTNSDIDLVHGDAVSINDKNCIIGYKTSIKIENKKQILKGITPIHPTVMAKKKWFCENVYLSDFLLIEDLELWYRTIEFSNYCNLNEPLIFYREISQNNSKKYLASMPSVLFKCHGPWPNTWGRKVPSSTSLPWRGSWAWAARFPMCCQRRHSIHSPLAWRAP